MAVTVLYGASGHGKMPLFATWTHSAGAAEETFTVAGRVHGALIWDNKSSGEYTPGVPYSVSLSGSVSTVTIHSQADVTDGRIIVYNSMA